MAEITLSTVSFNVGPRRTPQDIVDMRRSTFEYHRMYGQPVIHKHRWNRQDVKNGLTIVCPYHDVAYDQDFSHCPYCFGTGFLGGYADAQIVFATFSDATEDRIRIGPQGVLLFDREPQVIFPWLPDVGNGDLIIQAEFDEDNQTVLDTLDRYVLKEVTPVTIRGFQRKVQTIEYKVQQNAQMDRVPDFDFLYDVPLIFDPSILPPIPDVPPGGDPGDYPDTPTGTETSTLKDIRIVGILPANGTEYLVPLRVAGIGISTNRKQAIFIVGTQPPGDVEIIFESE